MSSPSLAKNTILLYIRIIVVTIVAIFSSRYVLNALGEVDYGIFNVIFGIVGLFLIISGAMVVTGNRFLISDMVNSPSSLRNTFSTLFVTHLIIAILFSILTEIVGLYLIDKQLQIPQDRLYTAYLIFQLSVVTLFFSFIQIPFQSVIIANEHFDIQAYLEIAYAILLLVTAIVTPYLQYDSLLVYSVGVTIVRIIIFAGYTSFSVKRFEYVTLSTKCNFVGIKRMFSFASWNFLGTASMALKMQGTNILLNIFFGPIVNTSRGIAFQVSSALKKLSGTMVTALGPRIVKNYDINDISTYNELICIGSKYSYQIMFIFSLPIFIASDYILNLWLGRIPEYSSIFVRLILVYGLYDTMSLTLLTAAIASKKVKSFYIMISVIELLSFIATYICIVVFDSPTVVFYAYIVTAILLLFFRMFLLTKTSHLEAYKFFKECIVPCTFTTIIQTFAIGYLFKDLAFNFFSFVLLCLSSALIGGILTYIFVAKQWEKDIVNEKIKNMIKKCQK